MEMSSRLEDALIDYLRAQTEQTQTLMDRWDAEMQHREELVDRLKKLMGEGNVEFVGDVSDLHDLLFDDGEDEDEDSGA